MTIEQAEREIRNLEFENMGIDYDFKKLKKNNERIKELQNFIRRQGGSTKWL